MTHIDIKSEAHQDKHRDPAHQDGRIVAKLYDIFIHDIFIHTVIIIYISPLR